MNFGSSSMASSSSSVASSGSYNSPCAACKFLRRKCMAGCIFAPYFPPEEPQKFANVHKIFGASNVTKLLNELLPHQREDAVNALAYEAEARIRDPVYGAVGVISYLQRQVQRLQKELDSVHADLIRVTCNDIPLIRPIDHYQFNRRVVSNEGIYYPSYGMPTLPYNINNHNNNNNNNNLDYDNPHNSQGGGEGSM